MPEEPNNNWRKKPRGERVTLAQVKAIMENFKTQGISNPSVRQIRTALGNRGSLGTIGKFKEQVLSMLSNIDNDLENKPVIKLNNNAVQIDNKLDNKLDNTFLSQLETQLWIRLESRLTDLAPSEMQKRIEGAITTIEVLDEQWHEKWYHTAEKGLQREEKLLAQLELEKNRANTAIERLSQLEKVNATQALEIKQLQQELSSVEGIRKTLARKLSEAKERIAQMENEYPDHIQTGQRVFKNELAFAVHYLVITAGMPQKEVATLLGLSLSDVSKLKNTGTKLHRKKQ